MCTATRIDNTQTHTDTHTHIHTHTHTHTPHLNAERLCFLLQLLECLQPVVSQLLAVDDLAIQRSLNHVAFSYRRV